MSKLAQTLLRSTDLSMAYIPCCAIVLMLHNVLRMCSTHQRNFKLKTNAESVLHIYAVRHSLFDYENK